MVSIGISLSGTLREDLIHLLREYANIFAWSASDMPRLDESVALHHLDVDPNREPVKQRRRMFTPERQEAIDVEVDKLLAADIIFEIKYPQWLANVVMVKKPNGK